jgi:hypothetical protein
MGFLARRLRDALARVRPTHLEPLAVLAAALALNALLARGTRPGEVGFAALEPGQRVQVAFESKGCFHHDRARIAFTRGLDSTLRYTSTVSGWAGRGTRSGVLDREEVARLDDGLRSWRRESDCRSTTMQKVRLTLYDRGVPVRSEHFRRYCGERDALDFAELLAR